MRAAMPISLIRTSRISGCKHRSALAIVIVAGLATGACERTPIESRVSSLDPDVEHGRQLIRDHGCGSCHSIRGVLGARGRVGPPLDDFGERTFVAGTLPNTPANVAKWLLDPPRIRPGTAMPTFDLEPMEADAIAAFLLAH